LINLVQSGLKIEGKVEGFLNLPPVYCIYM